MPSKKVKTYVCFNFKWNRVLGKPPQCGGRGCRTLDRHAFEPSVCGAGPRRTLDIIRRALRGGGTVLGLMSRAFRSAQRGRGRRDAGGLPPNSADPRVARPTPPTPPAPPAVPVAPLPRTPSCRLPPPALRSVPEGEEGGSRQTHSRSGTHGTPPPQRHEPGEGKSDWGAQGVRWRPRESGADPRESDVRGRSLGHPRGSRGTSGVLRVPGSQACAGGLWGVRGGPRDLWGVGGSPRVGGAREISGGSRPS